MSTPTPHPDGSTGQTPPPRPALGLSAAQVAGAALAAVSGAVCASWLGVTGTLAGAAIGSVVGTVGSATYTYSLQAGHHAVRRARGAGDRTAAALGPAPAATMRLPWARLAAAGAVALIVGIAALTLAEGLAGRPVSSLVGGDATGTTVTAAVGADHDSRHGPAPVPTTPTTGESGGPSSSPSPSPSPSDSPSPSEPPSTSPSPSDSSAPTPEGTGPTGATDVPSTATHAP